MDGFFVAKFKVGKPAKGLRKSDSEVAVKESNDAMETQEDVKFDAEEDKKYLEEGKRRQMKAKGLRVPPRSAPVVEPIS